MTASYFILVIFLLLASISGILKRSVETNKYKRQLSLIYIFGITSMLGYYVAAGMGVIQPGEPIQRELFRYAAYFTILGVLLRDLLDYAVAKLAGRSRENFSTDHE